MTFLSAVGVDLRLIDEQGCVVPWDGTTMGATQVPSGRARVIASASPASNNPLCCHSAA